MVGPTTILSNEHKQILLVIQAIENECRQLEITGDINKVFFEKAVNFIRNYADNFHHAKEEKILFIEFQKKNEHPEFHCNPIEQMLHEHEMGREFVRGMCDGIANEDAQKLIENCRNYARLLKEHIFKEDTVLYPMVDRVLSAEDQEDILRRFDEADIKSGDMTEDLSIIKKHG